MLLDNLPEQSVASNTGSIKFIASHTRSELVFEHGDGPKLIWLLIEDVDEGGIKLAGDESRYHDTAAVDGGYGTIASI